MGALSAIVRWSLHNRPIVLLVTAMFLLIGWRAAITLPVDAVPDITTIQVQVITSAPALSPVEVEQYVTVPVERAMAGIPRSTEVRSLSKYGVSVVTVVFHDDTDIYFARQLVGERLRDATAAVPTRYGTPGMGPISTGLGEIYQFVVENDAMTLMEKKELLDWVIAPQLRTVPGVVDVNAIGGLDRQYQVVLDPKRLQAAGFGVAQVVDAIGESNTNAGGGYVEHEGEHLVVGSEGLVQKPEDIAQVVLGTSAQGTPITIGSLGTVQFGPRIRRGASTKDGKGEVVVGLALMLMGENSRTVTEAVKAKLAFIAPSLPPGTRIEPLYDRSALVQRTISTVGRNLLEGAALVILVLLVLLGDLRAGLVVALMIPLSLLFAVIAMNAFGVSGNLMSLGAIDFGLLVDGAVIIVENVVRRLSERQAQSPTPLSAEERVALVEEATLEVRAASVFGEAIIAVVYLPILFLTGTEGKLFRPMAATVLLALLGAFVLSLTLVPVLTSYVVRPSKNHSDTWVLRQAQRLYAPLLRGVMRHRGWAMGMSLLALAGALMIFTRLGAEFVPQLDEGDVLVEARRLPGVSLTKSIEILGRVERALLAIPEIDHVVSKTGSPDLATDAMSISETDVYISLKPESAWRAGLTKDALTKQISATLEEKVPEVAAGISQPIQMRTNELVVGVKSDVAALIYGSNLDELAILGEQVQQAIRSVPGAIDVRTEAVAGLRYLRIIPSRERLARHGLMIEDVNRVVEAIAVGYPAGEVLEGERRFAIVVKVDQTFDGDLEPLRNLPLRSRDGRLVPLGDVAELRTDNGPAEVNRENLSRRLIVEFNVRGRDLLSVVREAQAAVAKRVKPRTGYRVEWGGQFEHYIEARARLAVVVPVALVLVGFLLWMSFHSMRAALLIFLNVPFAIIGGVVALWLRQIPFSISAAVGFVALFGVAVLNGLVLVSFARHLEEQGISHVEAITEAAKLRLRPVLVTALVASFGFLPMALSTAPGSEVQRPLATVVIGGIVTATLLTLLVLPAVYARFGRVIAGRKP
jgi:cobalt-zinc-cadmium resistance protein CzcA